MRRLHKILMMLTAIVSLTPALARAQGVAHDPSSSATIVGASSAHRGFGVGVAAQFWPGSVADDRQNRVVPNVLATWGDSAGKFHIDGMFGFLHQDTSNFDLGVRGWYHLHATASSDLSAGGGVTLLSWKSPGSGPGHDRQWDFEIEIASQMRVFIVPNVALLGSVGLFMYLPDSGPSTILISGNLTGMLGVAYYFQ